MANRKDYYYEEEHGPNMVMIYMVFIMSVVVLLVTGLVFLQNRSDMKTVKRTSYSSQTVLQQANTKTSDELISGSTLTSDQLDIWELPDTGRNQSSQDSIDNGKNGIVVNQTTGETLNNSVKAEEKVTDSSIEESKTTLYDMNKNKTEDDENEENENQTLIKYQDGTEEWIEINDNLELNDYDMENFKYQKPYMKYLEDGKNVSTCGVNIAGRLGTVDFSKLKKTGCDYVMVRIGARGYSSGQIVLDEKYKENLEGAKKAGLDTGVYFTTQAVSEQEVSEEVDTLLDIIDNYSIKCPVVLEPQATTDDVSRVDALTVDERTGLVRLFAEELKEAGYTPVISASKEWLLTKLDLEELDDYEICLQQSEDTPDYPYEFKMWQYSDEGTVKGIDEPTKMYISLK